MAVTFDAAGTAVATATAAAALNPTNPSTGAGRVLIAHVFYRNTTTTPSTPSGWTLLNGPNTIVAARTWAFGKIAEAGDSGAAVSFGTDGGTDLRMAQIFGFIGRTAGTITENAAGFAFEEAATAAITDVNVTTPVDGSIAVNLVAIEDDLPAPSFSPTNTGVSGGTWTENVAETVSSLGLDGTIGIQTAALATAGTIGGGTFTRGAADAWGIIGFYIRPDAPAGAAEFAQFHHSDRSIYPGPTDA